MLKKLILLIVLILHTQETAISGQFHENIVSNTVVRAAHKMRELYTLDQELKSTWSYQTLTVAKATYESLRQQSAWTPAVFLYCLGSECSWHNSPQLIYGFGHTILPRGLHNIFDRIVTYSISTGHAFSVYKNPTKHLFGYVSGFMSVYLSMNVLDHIQSPFIRRELQGVTYFCCREAGWAFYDMYSDQISAFMEKFTAPFLHFFSHDPSVVTEPERFFEEKRTEANRMNNDVVAKDDKGRKRTVVMPNCDNPRLKREAFEKFNTTLVPNFFNGFRQSVLEKKKFIFVMGEEHYSCNCYWQKRELLKIGRSLGIDLLLVEMTPFIKQNTKKLASQIRNFKITASALTSSNVPSAVVSRVLAYLHAEQLDFDIHPIDSGRYGAEPIWELHSVEYFTHMAAVRQGKMSKDAKPVVGGYTMDFRKCPNFKSRDNNMIEQFKKVPENSIGNIGAGHLGALYYGLQGVKDTIVLYASCAKKPSKEDKLHKARIHNERIIVFNEVFGHGCGDQYHEANQHNLFYGDFPEVIQLGVENDISSREG